MHAQKAPDMGQHSYETRDGGTCKLLHHPKKTAMRSAGWADLISVGVEMAMFATAAAA
jgi:hypothetical protein